MSRQSLGSQDYSSLTGLALMVGGTLAINLPMSLLVMGRGALLTETNIVNGMLLFAASAGTIHAIYKKTQMSAVEASQSDASNDADIQKKSRCKICCPPTPFKTFVWSALGLSCFPAIISISILQAADRVWLINNNIDTDLLTKVFNAMFIEFEMGALFALGKGLHKLIRYIYNDYTTDKSSDLLKSLDLTDSDLSRESIESSVFSMVAHPSFHGRVLRFFTTTSLTQALLRWPLMWRRAIGIDSHPSKRLSTEPLEIQTAGEDLITFLPNRSSDEALEQGLLDDESDTISTEGTLALPKPKPVSNACLPIFTPSAVPIRSSGIMRAVISLNALHDTAETVQEGVWNAFLSSLIVHNLINYFRYPHEFEAKSAGIWNILGIANGAALFCATKPPHGSSLVEYCKSRTVGYEENLASVLSEPFIWPLLLVTPIAFGAIDASIKAYNTRPLNPARIREQIQILRQYQPGFWTDVVGWVVSAAVPDTLAAFIPPAILFLLLPQPKIKRALETIRTHILWDGQLTARQRTQLFDALLKFSQTRTQFTQLKAFTILAEIADHIDFAQLKKLRKQGMPKEDLMAFVKIKTQALEALLLHAKHYQLPGKPKHYFRPLPRFIYANYLAWRLGRSQHLYLQPLYLAYTGIKLYFKLVFYQTLVLGMLHLEQFDQRKDSCESSGGVYQLLPYHPANEEYGCVCAGEIKSWSCYGYFNLPRTLEESLKFFLAPDNKGSISLDLSQQTHLIQARQLPRLLYVLKAKGLPIDSIKIRNQSLDLLDIQALAGLILNNPYNYFDKLNLARSKLPKGTLSILLNAFAESQMEYFSELNLSGYPLTNVTEVRRLAAIVQGIREINVDHSQLGDLGVKALSEKVSRKLSSISMKNCNITSIGCATLVNNLLDLDSNSLNLGLSNNPIDSACVVSLLNVLKKGVYDKKRYENYYIHVWLSGNNKLKDPDILKIANAFRSLSVLPLSQLALSGTDVRPESFMQLIRSFPQTLEGADFDFYYTHYHTKQGIDYQTFLPQLLQALNQSAITSFGWYSPAGDGPWLNKASISSDYSRFVLSGTDLKPESLIELIRSFSKAMKHFDYTHRHVKQRIDYPTFLPELVRALNQSAITRFGWHAPTGDGLGPNEALILSDYIRNGWLSNITDFEFEENKLGSGVVPLLIAAASHQDFDLQGNNITAIDLQLLAKKNYSVDGDFDIRNNPIGDQGLFALIEMYSGFLSKDFPLLSEIGMTGKGLQALADYFYEKRNITHPLWIDMLRFRAKEVLYIDLPWHLDIGGNAFKQEDLAAFCKVWIMGAKSPTNLGLTFSIENVSWIDNCLVNSASGKKIEQWMLWPLFRNLGLLKRMASHYLEAVYSYLNKASTTTPEHKPQTQPILKQSFILDLRGVSTNKPIVIDLNASQASIDRLIASYSHHHFLIGGENAVLDLSGNIGKNLLVPGINNTLYLSEKSNNHLIITRNLGALTIHHFSSSDRLHLIDQYTIFANTNSSLCQERSLANQGLTSTISLNNTQLHFIDTPCKTIFPQITYNNETAVQQAQLDVLQTPSNQNTALSFSTLNIAKTFFSSFAQSACFAALPFLMAELCNQAQLFSWSESYVFASQLQNELFLAAYVSSNAFLASILARTTVSRLTRSDSLASIAGIGASIVTSVIENLLVENTSMSWIVLQILVASMGAALGGVAVQALPRLTTWGWDKAKEVGSDLSRGVSFWSRNTAVTDDRAQLELHGMGL